MAANPPAPASLRIDDVGFQDLSLDDSSSASLSGADTPLTGPVRPASQRAITDPNTLLSAHAVGDKPRSRSPYARSHLRSQSHASALAAPPMARARSLPIFMSPSPSPSSSSSPARPASPLRSQQRASPRRSLDEVMPRSSTPSFMDIEIIAEDSELDITPRNAPSTPTIVVPPPLHSASFSRSATSRRRPSSPLHYQYVPTTTPPSPGANAVRFNESFPKDAAAASLSSYPSTPTSFRSRSPSVSSLDTIPDSPDAEEEAQEEFRMAQLKAAADAAEAEAEADKQASGTSRWGQRRERKRWSVCGAERRTDFEMETIWED